MNARALLALAFAAGIAGTQRGPQTGAGHFALGRAAYAAHHADSAVREFEKAVALDDRNANYHLWLARAVGMQSENASFVRVPGLAKRMRIEYERAVAIDPSDIEAREGMLEAYLGPAMFGGSLEKAQEQADAITRSNAMRGHIARAMIARHESDSAAVEAEWRQAAHDFPDSLVAVMGYADLLVSHKRRIESVEAVSAYVARRPNDMHGAVALGRVTALTGVSLEIGERALRSVIATLGGAHDSAGPSLAPPHFWLGEILRRRGDVAQAREEYERALAISPGLEAAKNALKALPSR